ncbi:MAG: DUF309 domain-containing protein [Rudaea sp.]
MLLGLEQFNRGEYWEQHETLEKVWRNENDSSLRNLYKGIIQVGVGFFHLTRGNLPGALKVLARGITYLRPYAPECCGVDVERLLEDATHVYWRAKELGPSQVTELKMEPLPRIKYAEHGAAGDA